MLPPESDPPHGVPIQQMGIQLPSPMVVQVVTPEKSSGPPRKSSWDKFVQLIPLFQAVIQAALTAGLAFILTGQVANAIQQRQLELNNVKEMQSLLGRLYEKKDTTDINATVAALTAFREYSVPPLTHLLQSTDATQRTAGESGLRTLALGDSLEVATELLKIVSSRNRICSWQMRQSAVRVLGNMGSRESLTALEALRDLIKGTEQTPNTEALVNISDPDASPDAASTGLLLEEINKAIARIHHGDVERTPR